MPVLLVGIAALSLVVGILYRHNRLGFWGNFIISLFLTPLVPVILNLFSGQPVKRMFPESFRHFSHRDFRYEEPVHPADRDN